MSAAFDVVGPLPRGTTVLEASAGTGKTYAIAALVTRYVAEGVADLDDLLVVTFGRAATRELRARVRAQMMLAERALAGEHEGGTDALLSHLLDASPEERALRRGRLARALTSYDAATIATIHEFCQLVLRSLGVAGDLDPGVTLVEDFTELVREVVDDVYLRRYADRTAAPFDLGTALDLGRAVTADPQAVITPDGLDPDSTPGERVDLAREVAQEFARRKRERGLIGYDDLLSRLRDSLAEPDSAAARRMRERWSVVLVDEFQDTDPVQWQVFDRAFHGHATMVLVGDPKQAIYAFRGGDVPSYLTARDKAGETRTLDTNWRSDAAVVDGLGVLLDGVALGDDEIRVHPVRARHQERRLAGAPDPSAVRVRTVHSEPLGTTRDGYVRIDLLRRHIAADLAADVVALLSSGATVAGEPVEPRDVAILVPTRGGLDVLRAELAARSVPSVVTAASNVLTGPAGWEWLTLLEALDQPQSPRRVRAAALTSLVGVTPEELDAGGDELTDELAERVRRWLDLFRTRGVAGVFEAIRSTGLAERVLATEDGARHLTDLAHVAETLHEVTRRRRLGTNALLAWLHEERDPTSATERSRRLDTDEDAVQILTVHGSKGLQFPFVYLPTSFHGSLGFDAAGMLHHQDGRRCLDVSGAPTAAVRRAARAEELAEELRLTYVALTRAEVQVTIWTAQSKDSDASGISRLLLGRGPGEREVPTSVDVGMSDEAVDARLTAWASAGAVSVSVTPARPSTAVLPGRSEERLDLRSRGFDRDLDTDWRRTSYSGLIRADEKLLVEAGSEPEEGGTDDEGVEAEEAEQPLGLAVPEAPAEPVSPMDALPGGATFGSLVHGVLEHADPQAPDLRSELRSRIEEQLRWWPVPATADDLADGLLPMQHTSMGPLAGGLTLAELPMRDRLCELDFEIPLAGGERPGSHQVLLGGLADLMERELSDDDLLLPYADRLRVPSLGDQVLRGYLSGSIDVVLRVPGERFVVVDYKTNRLGEPERPLTAWDYTQPLMADSMRHSHYPLQALLYSVVLHRYLRWRVASYDPERHLGGVLYLYVRGMCGPQTPVVDGHPCGCFAWQPPASLVTSASDLLAGGGL
ncbi:RecBCD enzyme subunit RecB [Marmoricola endophyticus]|uniref:RecBCD enzyme subunit RecB n=1 Tax=Marmoricola endophyticus TaxID=2040280 RepID=A0A917BKZ8_9ACTN|nr:UvrD-helicase domain-containing protein [Marmoricola endophyticus]GGF48286.1 RecBCD enzyme subunit RecB [Marmoricola endophyticus]